MQQYMLREYASVSSYFDYRDVLILNWINWYSIRLRWLYEENMTLYGYMYILRYMDYMSGNIGGIGM